MVGVAQLVEHLVVVQDVAGSSPVTHPTAQPPIRRGMRVSAPTGEHPGRYLSGSAPDVLGEGVRRSPADFRRRRTV